MQLWWRRNVRRGTSKVDQLASRATVGMAAVDVATPTEMKGST